MQAIETLILTQPVHKRMLRLMGNRFAISVVSDDADWAEARIENAINEIRRIEKMLDLSDDSKTSQINSNAGIKPVKVNGEIFKLITRSIEISALTQGVFDITGSAADGKPKQPGVINYKNIELNYANTTVFLKEKGMQIDFSRIGKGYAADRAKYLLQMQGVASGVVNAGGDLVAWGTQANGQPWTIADADPNQRSQPFAGLNISNMAVTTLGNYEPYMLVNGKTKTDAYNNTSMRNNGLKSVSMLSTSAELAEALATPLMLMGTKKGLDLINRLQQVACVIIDQDNCMYTSKSISFIN